MMLKEVVTLRPLGTLLLSITNMVLVPLMLGSTLPRPCASQLISTELISTLPKLVFTAMREFLVLGKFASIRIEYIAMQQ